MIQGLTLGLALERCELTNNYFFCIGQVEDSMYNFIPCPIAHWIWSYISQIWQVLSPWFFGTKIMGVCTIYTSQPKIKYGDRVPISTLIGI